MLSCFTPRTGDAPSLQTSGKRRSWGRRSVSLTAEALRACKSGTVISVGSKAAWYSELAEAWRDGILVVVQWSAPWLSVSVEADPVFEELARRNRDRAVRFLRVDMDCVPEIAQEYNVLALPCFMLIAEGLLVERMVGLASMQSLPTLLRQHHAEQPAVSSFTSSQLPLRATEVPELPTPSASAYSDYQNGADDIQTVPNRSIRPAEALFHTSTSQVGRWPSPTLRCTPVDAFQQQNLSLGLVSIGPAAAF